MVMLSIIFICLLCVWTIAVFVSMMMIRKYGSTLPIRTRGLSITLLLTIVQYFIVFFIGLRVILQNLYPCAMKLWAPGLLLPLWGSTLLARFLRVLFLHRINQLQLQLSSMILDCQNQDEIRSTTLQSDSSLHNENKTSNLNLAVNVQSPNGGVSLTLSNPTCRQLKPFPKVDSWLYENRGWFGSRGITLSLLGFLFINIVLTLLFQIVSNFSKGVNDTNQLDGSNCPNSWTIYPSLSITAFMLIMKWPIFFMLIKDMHETFGIRLELVSNLILAPAFLVLYIIDTIINPSYNSIEFKIVAFLCIGLICLLHLLTIGYPLWWAKLRFTLLNNRRKSKRFTQQSTLQAYSNTLNKASPKTEGSSLKDILENPVRFKDFKTFAAHNFCVENVLFYERYQSLRKRGEVIDDVNHDIISTIQNIETNELTVKFACTDYPIKNEDSDIPLNPLAASKSNEENWQETLRSQQSRSMTCPPLSKNPYMNSKLPRQSVPVPPPLRSNSDYNSMLNIRETASLGLGNTSSIDINCATPQTPEQCEVLAIYRDFIAAESAVQLNLTGFTKKLIQDKLKQGIFTPEIYNVAYEEVYAMLLQDIYPRYITALENGRIPTLN